MVDKKGAKLYEFGPLLQKLNFGIFEYGLKIAKKVVYNMCFKFQYLRLFFRTKKALDINVTLFVLHLIVFFFNCAFYDKLQCQEDPQMCSG